MAKVGDPAHKRAAINPTSPSRHPTRSRSALLTGRLIWRHPIRSVLYKLDSELYNFSMATFSISKARESLSDAVERSRTEAVFLERHGKKAAVMVSPERYEEMLEAFEEIEDVAAFDQAMAEESPNIPWDEAKADLGWD